MNESKIDNTFSECFDMWYSRILITAIDEEAALVAAQSTIGFATSIILCSAEAGIEQKVNATETPDGRPGIIIQIWTKKSKQMKDELLARLSQCAMTAPTTSIFNLLLPQEKNEPIGKFISYFGDGYQKKVRKFERIMWEVPVMDGFFYIEETFHMKKGIAGGLLILMGLNEKETLFTTRKAVKAIQDAKVQSITSFPGGICRSGSKIGSQYSFLKESTNHRYCPPLKSKIPDTVLSDEVQCVYELVINSINEEQLKKTMKIAIDAVKNDSSILKITSANFNGELGKIKINLRDLI